MRSSFHGVRGDTTPVTLVVKRYVRRAGAVSVVLTERPIDLRVIVRRYSVASSSAKKTGHRGEGEEKGLGLSAVDAGPRPLIAGKLDPPGDVSAADLRDR